MPSSPQIGSAVQTLRRPGALTPKARRFVSRYQTESFRIHRYRPYNGYRWRFFVNHWCRCGAGLLDVDRVPTLAYHAL
jgi:hypothetical protein